MALCCGSVAFLFRVGLGEEKFDKLLAVVFYRVAVALGRGTASNFPCNCVP